MAAPVSGLSGIAAVVFCLLISACENKISDIKDLTDRKTSVEQGIQVETFFSQAGKMKARLTAPLMKRYQTDTPYIEFPNRLHIEFYNDSLLVDSQLFANYGKYVENERKAYLRDSVVIFSKKGDTIYCQDLWWNQQTEKFYSDKPVRVHGPQGLLYGDEGMEASQDFSLKVLKKAHGPLIMPADSTLP